MPENKDAAACVADFGDFFENSAIPFHCVGADGRIIAANKAELELLGYSREEYIGAPAERFHEDRALAAELARRLARQETLRAVRARMKCKDGSVKDVLLDSNGNWVDGKLRYTRGALRDVSEQLKAEEALRRLNSDLEGAVKERTRDYQNFAHTVAHDLRAPLRSIQGFAQILLKRYEPELPAEGRELFARILSAAKRMDHLIIDLLTYSRMSSQDAELVDTPLESAVEQALGLAADDLRAAGADVKVDKPMPGVLAHPGMLSQALAHLLSNAAKFAVAGSKAKVTVRAERRGPRVRLWVEDEGIGIAEEHHERIFRVFQRLHGPQEYAGTGIGLAIVKRAAERLGGSAGVESSLGKGSKFWIELPASD